MLCGECVEGYAYASSTGLCEACDLGEGVLATRIVAAILLAGIIFAIIMHRSGLLIDVSSISLILRIFPHLFVCVVSKTVTIANTIDTNTDVVANTKTHTAPDITITTKTQNPTPDNQRVAASAGHCEYRLGHGSYDVVQYFDPRVCP